MSERSKDIVSRFADLKEKCSNIETGLEVMGITAQDFSESQTHRLQEITSQLGQIKYPP